MKPFDVALTRMYQRTALDQLPAHLNETYGIDVSGTEQLDVGVFRVDRRDGQPWVARVFSSLRPHEAAVGDAAVLAHVASHGYPAERLAADEPVSTLDGQAVLVTEFLTQAKKRKLEPDVYQRLGRNLGRLHSLPLPRPRTPAARPAGALHHFAEGSRTDELEAAKRWLDQFAENPEIDARALDALRAALDEADGGDGLPRAVIHPDPVPKNMVRADDANSEGWTLVDWTGAGVGPRIVSLEWLLASERAAPGVTEGYLECIALADEEWERLPAIAFGRQVIGLCFRLAFAPARAPSIAKRISAVRRQTKKTAAAAEAATAHSNQIGAVNAL